MKIALCQLNTVPGNIAHNTDRIISYISEAKSAGSDLVIFPELAVVGYPPKDLLEYPDFVREADRALERITAHCVQEKISAIVGVTHDNIFPGKKPLLNGAAYIHPDGTIDYTFKKLLPTYDVFDEERYFAPAPADVQSPVVTGPDGTRIAVVVCEDIWNDSEFWADDRLYPIDPVQQVVEHGADIIINISSSPFTVRKSETRLAMLKHISARHNRPIIMVNQVGGCDSVVFDGGSVAIKPDGTVPAACGWFEESLAYWDTAAETTQNAEKSLQLETVFKDEEASLLAALSLGLRDYMKKTGFRQVIAGNSGGIDSAVVLALSAYALGKENVISVTMPSRYSSNETQDDADVLAQNLGIRHMRVPIEGVHSAISGSMRGESSQVPAVLFGGDVSRMHHLAEENAQARIRGNFLMYISNAIADAPTLLLSTGNKSELAVGYCTLYGDMCGGLALISDLTKMTVYKLARYLNKIMGDPIPVSIIDREPSAELSPNQKDSDSLPPYPVLDEIVMRHVELRHGVTEIVEAGIADEAVVTRVLRMIRNAEYKRAQAAPGIKVTSKAFGFGRRMPIARSAPQTPKS